MNDGIRQPTDDQNEGHAHRHHDEVGNLVGDGAERLVSQNRYDDDRAALAGQRAYGHVGADRVELHPRHGRSRPLAQARAIDPRQGTRPSARQSVEKHWVRFVAVGQIHRVSVVGAAGSTAVARRHAAMTLMTVVNGINARFLERARSVRVGCRCGARDGAPRTAFVRPEDYFEGFVTSSTGVSTTCDRSDCFLCSSMAFSAVSMPNTACFAAN